MELPTRGTSLSERPGRSPGARGGELWVMPKGMALFVCEGHEGVCQKLLPIECVEVLPEGLHQLLRRIV